MTDNGLWTFSGTDDMHQHTPTFVELYRLEWHDFLGSQMEIQAHSRYQGQSMGFFCPQLCT